jgi:hypothetical protein
MDNVNLNYQKALRIQSAFNKYSDKMRDLRTKKFNAIVEYRKKIDLVKLDKLKADLKRIYKDA